MDYSLAETYMAKGYGIKRYDWVNKFLYYKIEGECKNLAMCCKNKFIYDYVLTEDDLISRDWKVVVDW